MPKFNVQGFHNGQPFQQFIDAPNEQAARQMAEQHGVSISSIATVHGRSGAASSSAQHAGAAAASGGGGAALGFGITALVLGILGLLIAWIPLINVIAIFLASLGLLAGIVALVLGAASKDGKLGMPVAGSAVCAVTLVLAFTVNYVAAKVIEKKAPQWQKQLEQAGNQIREEAERAAEQQRQAYEDQQRRMAEEAQRQQEQQNQLDERDQSLQENATISP